MRKGLTSFALAGILSLSGCDKNVPDPYDPEYLVIAGQDERGTYYFVETVRDFANGSEYRLHVKNPRGNNFIFYDTNQDGRVDKFPKSFSQEGAQIFYDGFVPEEYRD